MCNYYSQSANSYICEKHSTPYHIILIIPWVNHISVHVLIQQFPYLGSPYRVFSLQSPSSAVLCFVSSYSCLLLYNISPSQFWSDSLLAINGRSLVHSNKHSRGQHGFRENLKVFSGIKKLLGHTETRTRDRLYCQTIRSVRDISRDDRARIATCSLRTPTDRQTDLWRIIV